MWWAVQPAGWDRRLSSDCCTPEEFWRLSGKRLPGEGERGPVLQRACRALPAWPASAAAPGIALGVGPGSTCFTCTSCLLHPLLFSLPLFPLISQGVGSPDTASVWLSSPTVRGPRHPVCESPWLQAALRPPGYWAVSTVKVETPGGQGPHLPARLDIPAQGRSLPMRGWTRPTLKFPNLRVIVGRLRSNV